MVFANVPEPKPSPFFRPVITAAGILVCYVGYLATQGGALNFAKIAIVGGLLLASASTLGIFQAIRKKTSDWLATLLIVLGIAIVLGFIALTLLNAMAERS